MLLVTKKVSWPKASCKHYKLCTCRMSRRIRIIISNHRLRLQVLSCRTLAYKITKCFRPYKWHMTPFYSNYSHRWLKCKHKLKIWVLRIKDCHNHPFRIKIKINNKHRRWIKSIRKQGNSGAGIVGPVDVAIIGGEIVRRKRTAIKTTLFSVTAWVAAIKIVSDFYEERSWYKNNSYLDNNIIHDLPSHFVSSHNVDVLKADPGATKTYIKEIHKHNLKQYQAIKMDQAPHY